MIIDEYKIFSLTENNNDCPNKVRKIVQIVDDKETIPEV